MPAKQQNNGNICQICLKFKSGPRGPFCNGHSKSAGGSSGGGGAAGSSDHALSQGGVSASGASGVKGQSQALVPHSAKPSEEKENGKPLSNDFNEDIISYLLNNKLLTIKNDRESGMLTITCLSHLLSDKQKDELNKYTDLLLSLFEQFKQNNGIDGFPPQIKRDEKGQIKSIVLTLPHLRRDPELYDKFIAILVANNLLPQQMANQAINQPNKNQFAGTPFSTKPNPGENKKRDHEDHGAIDKKKHRGKLNPFDIHRGPKF